VNYIYIKYTVPELPEAVRTSISKVPMTGATPEATLATIRRQAAKMRVHATYELATKKEYEAAHLPLIR